MTIDKKINLDKIYNKMKGFSGAEVKAVCTEAGYFAIRTNRTKILERDILQGISKVQEDEAAEGDDYMKMFG